MTIRRLITKKELSEKAGVSQPAVSKLCKGRLAAALVGGQVDLNHHAVQSYLDSKNIRSEDIESREGAAPKVTTGHAAIRESKKQQRPPEEGFNADEMLQSIPEDIRVLADWTLRDLVQRFGTDMAFLDWLKATKEIENIYEKRVKNARSAGELVDKRLVTLGILDPVNTCHTKLLTDGAKSIATRSKALSDSGADVRDMEKMIADKIQSFIKPMKAAIKRGVQNFED